MTVPMPGGGLKVRGLTTTFVTPRGPATGVDGISLDVAPGVSS